MATKNQQQWNNDNVIGPSQVRVSRSLLTGYLVMLAIAVWSPVSVETEGLFGLIQIKGSLERLLNLLLLVPLPLLLKQSFCGIPRLSLLVSGPLLSVSIELVQKFVPGRVSDFIDVAMNSLGYLFVAMLVLIRNK